MKLTVLTPAELATVYAVELKAAFPPSELKPLSAMEALRAKGLYDPLCLRDESGEALGYALLWRHRDGRCLLLDYMCVPAARRGGGIGSALLRALRDHYPADTVLLAEVEAPTGKAELDEMILRRLKFYQRNGAALLRYDCALFGVHYKTICWADPMPEEALLLQKHREIYFHPAAPAQYDYYVQIPLHPGEAPRPVADWREDRA